MAALIVEKGVSVVLLNQTSIRSVGALGSLMVVAAASHAAPRPPQKVSPEAHAIEEGRRLLASRSARFVENDGQWKSEARFLARSRCLDLWYTDRGIRYDQISANRTRHQAVDMFFVGGRDVRPVGVSKLNAETQVFHGKTEVRGIGSYRELLKKNVVPGVDMRGYFADGKPRYDLIVAPGAKPSAIALGFRGANGLTLAQGSLKIGTDFGGIFNGKPVAYQLVGGKRVPVAASWTVAQGTARFKIGAYDVHRPLVIDPLVYGTYFGGEMGPDEVRAAITDTYNGANLGLFIIGSSSAPDFPGTSKPFTDTLNPEGTDAFVARIAASGTATDLSVLIGGQGTDVAQFVKQNPLNGDIYIAGTTISGSTQVNGSFNTFPASLTQGSTTLRRLIGTDSANASNYFVGRFYHRADGSLSFGSDDNSDGPREAVVLGTGIASAATGSAYLTGFDINPLSTGFVQMAITGVSDSAISTGLIAPPSYVTAGSPASLSYGYTHPGHRAGFLVRFQAEVDGNAAPGRVFEINAPSSQYVVGTRRSELRGVALDSAGNAYVVGTVYQPDNPTTADPLNVDTSQSPTFFDTTPNAIANANGTTVLGRILRATDAFVRIYAPFNTAVGQANLVFSGLVGGNGDDEAGGVACSLSVVPNTGSRAQPESLIPIYTGSAIAIDRDANIYITGTTRAAPNFPHTAGAFGGFTPPLGAEDRQSDVFVVRLSTGGARLDYAATLNAFASQIPNLNNPNFVSINSNYGPANFTTAMPAGIAVDSRGYVYVTGNLRPYDIIFANTYTTAATLDQPTSSTNSTIPIASASNTIDTVYDTTTTGSFPTTEGFLVVLNPSFSALQFASYIGGNLDDLVYAPNLDSSGNVIVSGWTDGARVYVAPYGTPPPYIAVGGGDPGFISGNAIKSIQDSNANLGIPNFGWEIFGTETSAFAFDQQAIPGTSPPTAPAIPGFIAVGRDGFVAQVSANLPTIVPPAISLTFLPPTILALGTTTGTVTLNAAQPLKTVVTITGPTLANLTPSDIAISGLTPAGTNTYTLTIPSGSLSATFTVRSTTVGNGGTVGFTASIPTNAMPPTSTSTSSVTIGGVSLGLSLNPTSVVGVSSGATVTGTITSSVTAPTALNFVVTVPNTAENRTIFNVGSSAPFATVDPNDPTKLDVATATIPANSTTGTFTFRVGSPDSPQILIVTASTVTTSTVESLTTSTSLTVNPIGLLSITPNATSIRGGVNNQLKLTVVFSGAISTSDAQALALTFSLNGVFAGGTLSPVTTSGTSATGYTTYTYTANVNRVTRSQDVTILGSFKGTTASTTVTVLR